MTRDSPSVTQTGAHMGWDDFFFTEWIGVARVVVIGACAYVALVAMLRISGKRTLAKLNAFDFVVTVAFGSVLASILLDQDVALAEGVTALAVLVVLQYLLAYLSLHVPQFADAIRSEPVLLARDGTWCRDAMYGARVTEPELRTVLRSHGYGDLADVSAIILEPDGTFSVLPGNASTPELERSFRHKDQ